MNKLLQEAKEGLGTEYFQLKKKRQLKSRIRDTSCVIRISAEHYATLAFLSMQTGYTIGAIAGAAIEYAAERLVLIEPGGNAEPEEVTRENLNRSIETMIDMGDDWEDEDW